MKSPFPRFAASLLLSVLVGITGCAEGSGHGAKDPSGAKSEGEGHAEVGKIAPDLSIQTLNGKGKFALDQRAGKVVVVDFWATWCAPCKKSFPKLEELSKRAGDRVEVIGISVDDEKNGVLDFAKETGATFAIGWDEGHSIAERWKLGTMPTTFIVDTNGKVRHVHDGYHDGEIKVIEKELLALLDETPGDTRVAKNDDAPKKSDDSAGATSTTSAETVASSKKTDDTAATTDDDPPPPPKKTTKKKGGGKKKKKPAKKPAPAPAASADG
jgi:thiol-disulfide isomerase/thioredoxin